MRQMLLFLGMVFSLFPLAGDAQTEESDAPYLYWFNDSLDAFIIERADGTDSRIFGEGLMPENTNEVGGAGWSPSGQWFAWTSRYSDFQGPQVTPDKAWVLNVDGKKRVTVTDQIHRAAFMLWSPVEDLLFIADSLDIHGTDDWHIYLIDVANNKIIIQLEEINYVELMTNATWTSDGKFVFYYRGAYLENNQRVTEFVAISREGIVTRQSSLLPDCAWGELDAIPCYTPDGRIIFPDENSTTLTLEDMDTGQTTVFTSPEGKLVNLSWSPSGEYALLFTCRVTPCNLSLWLLTLKTGQIELLHREAIFRNQTDKTCINYSYYAMMPWQPWRPDENQAIFADAHGNYYLLDAVSGVKTKLELPAIEGEILEWHWLNSNQIVSSYYNWYLPGENPCTVFVYNVTSGDFQDADIYPGGYTVFISNNGQKGASIPWIPSIYDLRTGTKTTVRPHGAKHSMAGGGGRIRWHPASGWFISMEISSVAGGGSSPFRYGVIKADGSLKRDFGVCWQKQCAGWLPSQVSIDELPSVSTTLLYPIPELVLKNTGRVNLLSWSPDSKLLLSGTGDDSNQQWVTLWDVWSQKSEILRLLRGRHQFNIEWIQGEDGTYIPDYIARSETKPVLATSPDGKYYISTGNERWEYRIYSAETALPVLEIENSDFMGYFSYSPDGQLLAGGGDAMKILLWEAESGKLITELPVYGRAVAFSPDGKWLAIGSSWDILIYDMDKIRAWLADE